MAVSQMFQLLSDFFEGYLVSPIAAAQEFQVISLIFLRMIEAWIDFLYSLYNNIWLLKVIFLVKLLDHPLTNGVQSLILELITHHLAMFHNSLVVGEETRGLCAVRTHAAHNVDVLA